MSKRAIIFDFFGVVCNDEYGIWLSRHGFARSGAFTQVSCQADLGQIDMDEMFGWLAHQSGQTPDQVRVEFLSIAMIHTEVIALIKKLKRSYSIGLLSNAHSDWLNALIAEHNLASLFDAIIISSDVNLVKPDPEIFTTALKRLKVSASETLFIDDKTANVRGAETVGITSYQYRAFDELIEFLRQHKVTI